MSEPIKYEMHFLPGGEYAERDALLAKCRAGEASLPELSRLACLLDPLTMREILKTPSRDLLRLEDPAGWADLALGIKIHVESYGKEYMNYSH